MRENRTSSSTSGERKRDDGYKPQVTAPLLDSTLGHKETSCAHSGAAESSGLSQEGRAHQATPADRTEAQAPRLIVV